MAAIFLQGGTDVPPFLKPWIQKEGKRFGSLLIRAISIAVGRPRFSHLSDWLNHASNHRVDIEGLKEELDRARRLYL